MYLCGLKQYGEAAFDEIIRCELVSKFCIFVVWNSIIWIYFPIPQLWIGFKILYLCGLKQCCLAVFEFCFRCELVSKFCIFVVWNSTCFRQLDTTSVVNWFQNFVSLWSETVCYNIKTLERGCELVSKFCIFVVWNSKFANWFFSLALWIGFKILYLCGLKQCNRLKHHHC